MTSKRTSHFFTVDVEEYFQAKALESVVGRDNWLSQPSRVERSVDALLALLDRHEVRGTFFTLGWLAKYRPSVVSSIADAGHELASHGFAHECLTDLTPKRFREDIRSAKRTLEDVAGREVIGYRAPNFSIVPGCEWAFDVLLEEGYRYDSSLFPIRRRGYGYPAARRTPHFIARPLGLLAEFPLATTNVFRYPVPAAGGGYLRHFPLAVIRRAFREADAREQPTTFYIHPWEVDQAQPRLPLSTMNRVRHYHGLGDTLTRIDRLLTEFQFGPIAAYLPRLEQTVPMLNTAGAA